MSRSIGVLQPALHRAQVKLDQLPNGAVVLDRYGHAWQLGIILHDPYWYRSYGDDSHVSSWELAQRGPINVIHEPKKRQQKELTNE